MARIIRASMQRATLQMRCAIDRNQTGDRVRMRIWATCGILALVLCACGNTTGERAVSGAGLGALGGAAVGGVTGGSVLGGAALGGAAGAAAGALTSPRQVDLNRR
jgi:osmotically inducible lipoprotein OsmB